MIETLDKTHYPCRTGTFAISTHRAPITARKIQVSARGRSRPYTRSTRRLRRTALRDLPQRMGPGSALLREHSDRRSADRARRDRPRLRTIALVQARISEALMDLNVSVIKARRTQRTQTSITTATTFSQCSIARRSCLHALVSCVGVSFSMW